MKKEEDEKRNKKELIHLSPSAIRLFENCKAGYLYSKIILPRVSSKKADETTNVGRKFHELAEYDFDEETTNALLTYEKHKTIYVIKDFELILKSRDYYSLPCLQEETLEVTIANVGNMIGIPDRVVDQGDGHFDVIDYKTSVFCYPDTDRRQVLSYAYLLWKVIGVDPDKLRMVIDYVRANKVFTYSLCKSDLEKHENYLISKFKAVKKLLDGFERDNNIRKIPHSPGDCNLCYMLGSCLPYQIQRNPHFDPLNPEELTTVNLIKEKIEREENRRINDARIKAINRALMTRYESKEIEEGTENKTPRDIIEEYLTKVQQTVEMYDTNRVVHQFVKNRTKKMIKGTPFQEMVDTQYLESEIARFIMDVLPTKLGRENVPQDLRKNVERYKERSTRAPYLRVK
jgi:CRISPR/Cas system-associated exonuclease Cas4 (RecB family)